MTGLTRSAAARIIAGHFGTQATHVGGAYDAYTIRDEQNRQWKVVSDASIRCRNGSNRAASRDYSVEFVSPICQYEDIETVQELVRKLRTGGARVNDSCGIHVHVDASAHTPQTLRNIVNIMAAKEDLLYKALQVKVNRENYCRKADTRFLEELNHKRPKTMDEVEELWYNGLGGRYSHYDDSRYHALNLHSVFSKGTIEFRLFNSTLHAGEVKSYIQLCLAISHQALVQRGASRAKTHPENEKCSATIRWQCSRSSRNTDESMSRSGKKQNAARNGGTCGRSIRLIFTCFGQQLYELCRSAHGDRRFAVILCVPRHDAVCARAHRRLDHHGILKIGNLR